MKVLFLYTEVAGYVMNCLRCLGQQPEVEVYLVHWKVNEEAPFMLDYTGIKEHYNREDITNKGLITLAKGISPDIIYCAGWVDKGYLSVCKEQSRRCATLLGFDNHWIGSLKQMLSSFVAKRTFIKYFTHCFVPGKPQQSFAKKLGFKESQIINGLYCADTNYFESVYEKFKAQKQKAFPKRFIYVGRYYHFKGVKELWRAFVELQNEMPNEWELWCLGTGDVEHYKHERIKHFGFVQPNEMEPFLKDTGVFILPSKFEPWGVVVHEFAAAGYPILCSKYVGAASAFLKEGVNGFSFDVLSITSIKESFKKIITASDSQLVNMGKHSRELASMYTPSDWSKRVLSASKSI